MRGNIQYTNSKCEVKVYHYINDIDLSVESFIIKDLLSVQTQKEISNPSGMFTIKIAPSKNWKKKIKPGDWLTIAFENRGVKRIRMLGNVDRVAKTKEVNDKGVIRTVYAVYGRDFGKVFEKTNIYFNPFLSRNLKADIAALKTGLIFTGSPKDIINRLLDVFLGPGTESIPELQQWYIPSELKRDILPNDTSKSRGPSFFDVLDKQMQDVIGYKAYKNLSDLQGFLWNLLKQNSNEPINELFVELIHDKNNVVKPTIVLRPYPYTTNAFDNPGNLGALPLITDIPRVRITDKEIIFDDVGNSDHVRFNFILLTSSSPEFINENLIADVIGSNEVPVVDQQSINKYGLRLRTDTTEFAAFNNGLKEKFDPILLKHMNFLLAHWWLGAHRLESGTLKIVGNLDVEIGKTIEITNKYDEKYLYYIEGYDHQWEYPKLWTTTLKLTRGQYLDEKNNLKDTEEYRTETDLTGKTITRKR